MYTAKIIETISHGEGYWSSLKIGVFDKDGNKVTEYVRNYDNLYNTFSPFLHKNKWYALFSSKYTCTSVMSLPDGNIVATEEPTDNGFCPVEYFVPRYMLYTIKGVPPEKLHEYPEENHKRILNDRTERFYETRGGKEYNNNTMTWEEFAMSGEEDNGWIWHSGIHYDVKFSFIAGCLWGDDNYWKVQRLDLSNVDKGILKRSEDFGYLELPHNQKLFNAISFTDDFCKDDFYQFHINTPKCFRFQYNQFREMK